MFLVRQSPCETLSSSGSLIATACSCRGGFRRLAQPSRHLGVLRRHNLRKALQEVDQGPQLFVRMGWSERRHAGELDTVLNDPVELLVAPSGNSFGKVLVALPFHQPLHQFAGSATPLHRERRPLSHSWRDAIGVQSVEVRRGAALDAGALAGTVAGRRGGGAGRIRLAAARDGAGPAAGGARAAPVGTSGDCDSRGYGGGCT